MLNALVWKKEHEFLKLTSDIHIGHAYQEWQDTVVSTAGLCGAIVGGTRSTLEEIKQSHLAPSDDIKLVIEATTLALEITDRLAFSIGGQVFRDQLLEFLELPVIAVTLDTTLSKFKSSSKEQAKAFPLIVLKSTISDIQTGAPAYANIQSIMKTDSHFSQDGSLTGVFHERIGSDFGVQGNPTWLSGTVSSVANALVESDCAVAIKRAAAVFSPTTS